MSNPDHGETGPQDNRAFGAADIYRNLGDQTNLPEVNPDAAEHLSEQYPVTSKINLRLDAGGSLAADADALSVIPDEVLREQGIRGKAIGIIAMESAEGQEGSSTSFVIIDARSTPGASSYEGGPRGVFDGDDPIDTGEAGFILLEIETQSSQEGRAAISETRPIAGKEPTVITGITRNSYPIGLYVLAPTELGEDRETARHRLEVSMSRKGDRVVVGSYAAAGPVTIEHAIDVDKYERDTARTQVLIENFNKSNRDL